MGRWFESITAHHNRMFNNDNLKHKFKSFLKIYNSRPIKDNTSGMRIDHCFAVYCLLKKIKPTIVVVISYGQIIPKEFLELSKNGFLNIHASILPKFRGAAPIQRAIMSQDIETGISFMKINENGWNVMKL